MKNILSILCLTLVLCSCENKTEISQTNFVDWAERTVDAPLGDSLLEGTTYLSIYTQIYYRTQDQRHGLTATASMRNTNEHDTIYIVKAEYFDEKGKSIRTYFDRPIFIAPMETVEIVIAEDDREGGANTKFLFDWKIHPNSHEPLFEGVMISTTGQQGLSFTTQGKRTK